MKKLLYALMVILILFVGCDFISFGGNELPVAYIDSISPSDAASGETVAFVGHGTDADGTVVAYRWRSSIDGELSVLASFDSSELSGGEHTIYLKVQDNNGAWSKEAEGTLVVSGAAAGRPAIMSFTASPGSISPGGTSTLSWEVSGADTASIDGGIGSVSLSGNRVVAPVATTTYTLTATGAAGSVTATARVLVSGTGDGGAAGAPVINYFTADPENVAPGGDSVLSWSVSNADAVTISTGTESVTVGSSGSIIARPAATTTFTLTATNASGGVTGTALVSVGAGGAGPSTTDYFTATPENITAGESVELSWSVSNVDKAWLSFVGGSTGATQMVAPAGSKAVSPSVTTTYTLSAGDFSETIVVTVAAAPAEEHTALLEPEPFPKSGQVQSNGNVFGIPSAGDLASNVAVKAYFGFDITSLAGAEVTNAVLSFTTTTVIGTPWPDLTFLFIEAVDYGPVLDAGDFSLMGDELRPPILNRPTGVVNINVTSAVQYYVNHGADRFQVLAWFARDSDNDGAADYWRSIARLSVTYLE